ncbi:hypothetical protein H920_04830 [Fukomys damarensis]|uniref:Uncharacterized protein n=1 Tax=Fukomys damarensis TaxID=885580 RepID=A0A091EEN3_FUKDA|nr:hypothetical protein H920_04830 [Fukomys damarensis]
MAAHTSGLGYMALRAGSRPALGDAIDEVESLSQDLTFLSDSGAAMVAPAGECTAFSTSGLGLGLQREMRGQSGGALCGYHLAGWLWGSDGGSRSRVRGFSDLWAVKTGERRFDVRGEPL